jgi:NADH-ubiquinone oxidoreductase chain 5
MKQFNYKIENIVQIKDMVLACGLFYFDLSFFHLINHAFFKALLFLCSGVIIHSFFNQQDIRFMGGFLAFLPFVYSVFLIGSLSLAGFPFLTGFYSKDLILEYGLTSFTVSSYFVFWLALLTVGLTSFYSFRLLYFLFYHKPFSLNFTYYSRIHSANIFGLLPLAILAIFAILAGYLAKDLFVGLGSAFLPFQKLDIDAEVLPISWKLTPLIFSLSGFFLSYIVYFYFFPVFPMIYPYMFFSYKWYFDVLYNRLSYNVLLISYIIPFKSFDRGLLEWFGAKGLGNSLKSYALNWQHFHSGDIFHFTFFFFISVLSITAAYALFTINAGLSLSLGLLLLFLVAYFI